MIKNALQYLIGLGKTEVIKIGERTFTTKSVSEVKDPVPSPCPIKVRTLSAIIDFIKKGDAPAGDQWIIHVESPESVSLTTKLLEDYSRATYMNATAIIPKVMYDRFLGMEEFNIMLQAMFVKNETIVKMLKIVGNVKEENVNTYGDDGVSQSIVAKAGIAKVEEVPLPNPVIIAPYRTFMEVEQPVSKFIFRMKQGPVAALFEADGGAWRMDAILNIADYLKKNLDTEINSGKVHVIA
jgi:hypothetical protein